MRDFRNAKVMAQSLREAMGTKQITLSHSEALEVVSKMLGVADWNTLSALIETDRGDPTHLKQARDAGAIMPVLPIKDLVPFPNVQLPLWIKRPRTVEALNLAFSNRRELVLVAQRGQVIEEPEEQDVYDVGVIARVLDVGPPSAEVMARSPALEGSTQVLLQTQGRVSIRKFSGQAGRYEAEIEQIDEGAIEGSAERIEEAASRFDTYAAARDIVVPPIWPPLRQLHDPGRVADIIAQRLPLAVKDKQAVLAMLDPLARLELVLAHIGV
ncbi:MAG: LON peptidase substrate-binding domain-containing protein [Sphingomonas sp.]|nr:LON peptidase substrate-binding domain-containing protein [Sphingomonas sp.]